MCKPCNLTNYQLTSAIDYEHLGNLPVVDNLISDFITENDVKGCAVGIVCNNQIHYLKSFGLARENGSDTDFRYFTPSSVGSISKTLTSLAILRLFERGFLDINHTINLYIPTCPANWRDIRIVDLLSHESGLPWSPTMNFPSLEEDLIKKFPEGGDHPGIHPRYSYYSYRLTDKVLSTGTTSYSNIGYAILGAIIDFVTTNEDNGFAEIEKGYENFVWWNVGMKGGALSGDIMLTPCLNAYWRQSTIPNLAFDYPDNGNSFFNIQYTGWEGPAGGWTMTIGDLARLMIMINTNQIISQDTKELMMTNYGAFGSSRRGLGVFRPNPTSQSEEYFNQSVFFNSGRIGNYDARFTMWEDRGFGIALMFNSRTNASAIKQLTLNIARHFVGSIFTSMCGINDIVMSSLDSEKINSHLYCFMKNHKKDLINILELYQFKYGNLGEGVQAILSDLGAKNEKKLMKYLLSGEFETIARLLNKPFKEKIRKLESTANSMPQYNIE